MAKLKEGAEAPAFTLPDARGQAVSLRDFRGRDVVVYFYPRDDTPGCTKEACGFRDLWGEMRERGVVVLGISADGAAAHERFVAKYGLPFALLTDADRKVMEAYGAYGRKVLYGKVMKGVIRSTVWVGPDGRVARHWAKVRDAGKHPAEVWTAIRG